MTNTIRDWYGTVSANCMSAEFHVRISLGFPLPMKKNLLADQLGDFAAGVPVADSYAVFNGSLLVGVTEVIVSTSFRYYMQPIRFVNRHK